MTKTSKREKRHIPLVIGNWKMNPPTVEKAEKLVLDIKKSLNKRNGISEIGIAAPAPFISIVKKTLQKSRIYLGAQDVSCEEGGAHTGEVSISMLKSFEVKYIIVGHSERRATGETQELVTKKVIHILKNGLTAVLCVGEKTRDTQGDYFSFVENELTSVLSAIPKAHLSRLVIAYEPIWAIGTGKNATSEDIQEMKLFIQKVVAELFDRAVVNKVRIIYGGSVNKDNAEETLKHGNADGFLVGGASLKAVEFAEIIRIADAYGKI